MGEGKEGEQVFKITKTSENKKMGGYLYFSFLLSVIFVAI